ncbi:MAG: peptide chain release factor-like protein [Opitutaceae bacterium]
MRKNGAFPFLDEALDQRLTNLGVKPDDVEERFVRGSGPGGQKINKTSSTVWLIHRPTGLQVKCKAGRSQSQNRDAAWEGLADKLQLSQAKAIEERRNEVEANRRRTRPRTAAQKRHMVEAKLTRARRKLERGNLKWD